MAIELSALSMLRIGTASPELRIADPLYNADCIIRQAEAAVAAGCRILIFPELSLSGYSCGDLFGQSALLAAVEIELARLARISRELALVFVVGAPLADAGRLYNCGIVIAGGAIAGVVPKTHLPNSQEFYERRWFTPAADAQSRLIRVAGTSVPFGTDLLFTLAPEVRFGIELCEDLWSPSPPSGQLAAAGANLIVNLSASPETLGKSDYRRELVRQQSARCYCAYAYAGAGPNESSTDLVFSGHSLIAENGTLLAESERFSFSSTLTVADIDCGYLESERRRSATFAALAAPGVRTVDLLLPPAPAVESLARRIDPAPFVPADPAARAGRCAEIFAIQTTGLCRRLRHANSRSLVLGISGGLDSTLALLVAVRAFDRLSLNRHGIVAVTMPGFGTTSRTRSNAEQLAKLLGVTLRIVPIAAAVELHFTDIGHDGMTHDITYENAQARERTQILMDIANQENALVLGTGDLSELALGWCTYNGDHMSMYGVNSGVPKTLVRDLVEWCASEAFSGEIAATLHDVAATPVSPELLPPRADGGIAQVTEEQVGPYRLHDFFLYNVVRLAFPPRKVFFLATVAFAGVYDAETIRHWLKTFYRRFFSQQFKRSCLPDGPKVGSVALSPRGDWRMPSDAAVDLWLRELDGLDEL